MRPARFSPPAARSGRSTWVLSMLLLCGDIRYMDLLLRRCPATNLLRYLPAP